MRTLPRLHAVLIAANEVRRRGEPFEVLRLEPRLPIRRGQLGERVRPCPPSEALPAARECLCRRHALAPDDAPGTRASQGAPSRASVSPDTRASYARRVAARFDPTRHSRAPEDLGRAGRGIRHCGCLRVSLAHERRQTGSASRNARNGHRQASTLTLGRCPPGADCEPLDVALATAIATTPARPSPASAPLGENSTVCLTDDR